MAVKEVALVPSERCFCELGMAFLPKTVRWRAIFSATGLQFFQALSSR